MRELDHAVDVSSLSVVRMCSYTLLGWRLDLEDVGD